MDAKQLHDLGQQLRVDAVRAAAAAGSGHPTSSMSAADLMAVLLAEHLRYDFTAPAHPGNDRLIFSKGHASPLLHAMYRAVGVLDDGELLSFRGLGSRLEGHPTPRLPWADVATGSLGLGLPTGVGMALAATRLEHGAYHVWVLCGDSELAEGSMWEAFEHAGYERLDNLTAIVDVNRLGQRGETRHGWDTAAYARRIGAFGWHTIEIDGHDIEAIDAAYTEALQGRGRPTAILARTMKGRGVAAVQDIEGAHGKPLRDTDESIAELGGIRNLGVPDAQVLCAAAADTGCFVTVEDHWPEGGLGEAVLAAFANGHQAPRITKLAVHAMPGSATPAEQLHAAGIDAKAIEAAARALAGDRVVSG